MNNNITHAEVLAKFFSFNELKAKEQVWEDFYDTFTGEYYDAQKAKEAFENMTIYLLAMSMKELNHTKNWEEKTIYTRTNISPEEYN